MLGDIDSVVIGESLIWGVFVTFTETEADEEWLGLPDIDPIGVELYIFVDVTMLLADVSGV